MGWIEAFDELRVSVASREQLVGAGASGRMLTAAVRAGHLVRLRRDHYSLPSISRLTGQAVRVGGRLACVSALRYHGVFALKSPSPHVHVAENASRLRSSRSPRVKLSRARDGVELHWHPLLREDDGDECVVGLVDALAQAVRCQPPVLAVAALDNALFLELVSEADVREIFATLPARLQKLEEWLDPKAEAGQETVLRRLLHDAGLHYESQVELDGVGRVDFVVEGRLIVEADSKLAHEGWEKQVRDRRRDLVAAALGFTTLRPVYEHTMFEPGLVLEAVLGALA